MLAKYLLGPRRAARDPSESGGANGTQVLHICTRYWDSRRSSYPRLFLAFLSPTLAMAWQPAWVGATSAGGDGYTLAHSIKVAPNNDYYVTGEFSSTAKFSVTTLKSRGGSDIF